MSKASITPSAKAWFLVMRSSDIKPGEIKVLDELDTDVLLYRTKGGVLRASTRFCPHLETDLVRGWVDGENIVCPNHSWQFDGTGKCVESPLYENVKRRLKQYSVQEKFGGVFVCLSKDQTLDTPFSDLPLDQFNFGYGATVDIDCDWHVIAANGYDVHHFKTVHHRFFHEPAVHQVLDENRFQIQFKAGSTGKRMLDFMIKKFGKNIIKVRIINHTGTLLTVDSDVGFMKSSLLISLNPVKGKTRVRFIMGMKKRGLPLIDKFFLWMALNGSETFLTDDLGALTNLRMRPGLLLPEDVQLKAFYDWLPHKEKMLDKAEVNGA